MKKIISIALLCTISSFIYSQNCGTVTGFTSQDTALPVGPDMVTVTTSSQGNSTKGLYIQISEDGEVIVSTACFLSNGSSDIDIPIPNSTGTITIGWIGHTTAACGGTSCAQGGDVVVLPVVLPVSWSSFIASDEKGNAKLLWETHQELNSDYFEIEHSIDGREYESIGRVEAAGTTAEITQYEFLHTFTNAGINYYRIKQMDFDGNYDYSDVVTMKRTDSAASGIYPNPVKSRLHLDLPNSESVPWKIFNTSGQLVLEGDERIIHVNDLSPNIYYIRYEINGDLECKRFSKID